jgi:putative restriction endonuclease
VWSPGGGCFSSQGDRGSYPGRVIGTADHEIRSAAFRWLDDRRQIEGDVLRRDVLLQGFEFRGRRVGLLSPAQGIWKPAVCELPLSVATTVRGPYQDSFEESTGRIRYSYRGSDPGHRDNRGLRRAMAERVPLIYFHAVVPGRYLASYPAFITQDDPTALTFWMEVGDSADLGVPDSFRIAEDADARRAYVTASVRRRLHQASFRERVLQAYRQMCALCRLGHLELLDAAHITPDSEAEGDPLVSNGLALCKLHHAAFDSFFFTVTPDYRVVVRESIREEKDGPMLVIGLQQIHDQLIQLPTRLEFRPDRDRLAARLERFQAAS